MIRIASKPQALRILDIGQNIGWNGRQGEVAELRPEVPGYLIAWKEHSCPLTGLVKPPNVAVHSYEDISAADEAGLLQIHIADTMAKGAVVPRYDRTEAEERRRMWRLSFVQAARDMIAEGLLVNKRADFVKKFPQLRARGMAKFFEWDLQRSGGDTRRGGAVVDGGKQMAPPKSGSYLHCMFNQAGLKGDDILYDDFRAVGATASPRRLKKTS